MTDRKCSCCGESYTVAKGHDLKKCIETCQERMYQAERNLVNAAGDLEQAYQRQIASLRIDK